MLNVFYHNFKKRLDYLAKVMPSRTLHYKMPFPFLQLAKNLWVILPNCANIYFPNKVSHNDFSINREHSVQKLSAFFILCAYIINLIHSLIWLWASQVALVVKTLFVYAGDIRNVGSIPGSGRSPGEGHGNPLQYSCLENPMDRENLVGYSP